ncbi:MAG: hypothetical protein FJY67_12120, partial [Calditrichaeota bacterium]|nr:hypothetical protein [Calditrichota bacterium]
GWTTADLSNAGNKWHTTETHAFEGRSWWCADPRLEGYDNHWLQYLMTPVLDLSGRQNLRLTFKLYWAVEEPNDVIAPYNGWDGCNVWISTNGGGTWQVLTPSRPQYTNSSLYSFGVEWGMGEGIPGWCGRSNDWVDAEFDLSNFARANVRIRWAFCSDPAWATVDNRDYYGMLVDNLSITSGQNVVWSNNGNEQGDMAFAQGPSSGDFWELSQADPHEGRFSAHVPVRAALQNALISPPIEVPEEPWSTWFDFWVKCNMLVSDADNDGFLDDYWRMEYSTDEVQWTQMLYDWSRNDAAWRDEYHFFGPDSFFRSQTNMDRPEWMRKLNLTQFAGQRVWIRWVARTDSVMDGNQGTGLWIDDVRLNVTSRRQFDVGVKFLRVNYPTLVGFSTRCQMAVQNYGLASQEQVRKYWRIEEGQRNPVIPWGPMAPDSVQVNNFFLDPRRIPAADALTVYGMTDVNNDQARENDILPVPNVVFYPAGISVLGYDDRTIQFRYGFDQGSGPMVYFTPVADGVTGQFDVKALRVRWDRGQQGDADVRLHIYANNNGAPGQEIHSETITVTQADLNPRTHVIDLTEVNGLQRLQANFWVWFELLGGDRHPQVLGDEQKFGQGKYFEYNGNNRTPFNADWMVHAVLMPAGAAGTNLVAGTTRLDFGPTYPTWTKRMKVMLFNGNTEPVTIESASLQGEHFAIDTSFHPPITLRIGDLTPLWVNFTPPQEGDYSGEITFTTNDDTPPTVALVGRGLE